MFEAIKIKKNVFFSIVLFLLFTFVFTFVFSHRSFFNFEKKHKLIKMKKEEITALKIEIAQLNENINRLKTDREYVVSFAKTFGYIDKTKKEQIVRIVESPKNDTAYAVANNSKKDSKGVSISITASLILASLVILVIGSYLIVNFRKRNLDNNSNS